MPFTALGLDSLPWLAVPSIIPEYEDDDMLFEDESGTLGGPGMESDGGEDLFMINLEVACGMCSELVGRLNGYVSGHVELSDLDDEFRRKLVTTPWLKDVCAVLASKWRGARRICQLVRDVAERSEGCDFASDVFRRVQDIRLDYLGFAGFAMYLLYATMLVPPDQVRRGSWQLFWLGPEFGLDPLRLDEMLAWRDSFDARTGQGAVCDMIIADEAEHLVSAMADSSPTQLAQAVRPQVPYVEFVDRVAVEEWLDESPLGSAAFDAELREGEEMEYLLQFAAFCGSPRCVHELVSRGANTLGAFLWAVRGGSTEVLEILHRATPELPPERLETVLCEAARLFELGMFAYLAERRNLPQALAKRVFEQAVRLNNAAAAYEILRWACDTRIKQYVAFLSPKRSELEEMRQHCTQSGNRELLDAVEQLRSIYGAQFPVWPHVEAGL